MKRMNEQEAMVPPAAARKRKMLVTLPLIVLPFLTLAFWALGGGRGGETKEVKRVAGLNLDLPGQGTKKEPLDKLGFYEEADRDSLKRLEAMRNDPFFADHSSIERGNELEAALKRAGGSYEPDLSGDHFNAAGPGAAEQKLMEKLQELNAAVSRPASTGHALQTSVPFNDAARVNIPGESAEGDSELQQLNTMMDKIIRIQHPGEEASKPEKKGGVARVSAVAEEKPVDGFFLLQSSEGEDSANAITAVVAEEQTLVSGGVIRLQSTSDLYIRGERIPAGNFLFGITALRGERLEISIPSIRSGQSLYAVNLEVFDLDGLPGIYVPGAIGGEVARQSMNDGLGNLPLSALDPSLAAQATAAGIGAVRNLVGKKLKQVRVTVKGGYQLLIKNKNA